MINATPDKLSSTSLDDCNVKCLALVQCNAHVVEPMLICNKITPTCIYCIMYQCKETWHSLCLCSCPLREDSGGKGREFVRDWGKREGENKRESERRRERRSVYWCSQLAASWYTHIYISTALNLHPPSLLQISVCDVKRATEVPAAVALAPVLIIQVGFIVHH